MSPMTGLACTAFTVMALVAMYVIAIFNRLVALRQHTRDSWAGIQVELKRRYDLIPNLVETVKGYAAHERDLFDRVARLRAAAMANEGSPASQSGDEVALIAGLRGVMAVAEGYPELKADGMFRGLQTELVNTEDRIAATRRFYNGNVRTMNQLCRSFPSSIIAEMFGFAPLEYFELEDAREAEAPRVDVTPG